MTSDGKISAAKSLSLLPLSGAGAILGRAVVLHSKADDCKTQPTGASGSRLAFCVIGVANASTTSPDLSAPVQRVVCNLRALSAASQIKGTVWLDRIDSSSAKVTARIEGVSNDEGPRGLHIHQFGDLADEKGLASGGHYNPGSGRHALPPVEDRHYGDLGNLAYYVDDIGWYSEVISFPSGYSLDHALGRAVVLHSAEDDGCTQPTGNAGSRLAICVLGLGNQTASIPTIPASLDILPQAGMSCEASLNQTSNIGWAVAAFILLLAIAIGFIYNRSRAGPTDECLPDENRRESLEREKLT